MDDSAPAWPIARRIGIKAVILVTGLLCLTHLPYVVVGLWNRAFGGWRSVFLCYAGSPNFVATYAPGGIARWFLWRPSPIGILRQDGALGLVMATPMSEQDFLDPANAAAFRHLRIRLRRIAWMLGVEQINLAGILPSTIPADDVLQIRDSRPVVVAAVCTATRQMSKTIARHGTSVPIILLGGAGYVGAPAAAELQALGYDVHIVDPKAQQSALPKILHGRTALLIDISRKGVIGDYIDQMWPGLIVLNETFPRTSRKHVGQIQSAGVELWHLSGVAGRVTPPLPFGYDNAVPCCAAHVGPPDAPVRIVRLTDAVRLETA